MLQMLEGVALKQTLWVVERDWAGSSRARMKERHQRGGGDQRRKQLSKWLPLCQTSFLILSPTAVQRLNCEDRQ